MRTRRKKLLMDFGKVAAAKVELFTPGATFFARRKRKSYENFNFIPLTRESEPKESSRGEKMTK
jgi:hypothetical protein